MSSLQNNTFSNQQYSLRFGAKPLYDSASSASTVISLFFCFCLGAIYI